jgi:undecaprenyl-diphosphatase
MSPDLQLFRLINSLAGQFPLLDGLMRLLVNEYFVPTSLSLTLIVLWFGGRGVADREGNQRAVIQAALSLILANSLVKLCNLITFRPRPFAAHEVNLLFYRPTDSSLPSNPAAVGFSFATAVWLHNRQAGAVMYVLAALFAFARVYCGVHYPLDVIVGGLIGALSAYLVVRKLGVLDPLISLFIRLGRRLFLA